MSLSPSMTQNITSVTNTMKRNDLTLTDLGDNISKLYPKTISPNFSALDTLDTAEQGSEKTARRK